jgi:DNA-binding MarR family transcriptional regulator
MKFQEYSTDPTGEFPLDVPEYFFHLLSQVSRRRDSVLDVELAGISLTAARLRTLAIIRRVEGCTMNTLAQLSTIDRTTLTREVDQLVALDLVMRSVPPHDRRQISLSLTPNGDRTYKQGIPILRAFNRKVLKGAESEKLREVVRTLRIAVRNLVADPAKAEDVIAFGRAAFKPQV